MRRAIVCFIALLLFACDEPVSTHPVPKPPKKVPVVSRDTVVRRDTVPPAKPRYSPAEQALLDAGLVDISSIDSTIVVELRYSTENNFLGIDMYGDFEKCFLQPDVAQKLVKAQRSLKARFPYYSLIVYDAVRPMHIQQMMWDTLDLPPGERQKYLSNPAHGGSLHNYGAAVDVSIIDEHGITLDMGTPYDFFGEKAHPEKEAALLESGELTERQVLNRELLRSVMRQGGFFGIQTEWWHFNACTREAAQERYVLVE